MGRVMVELYSSMGKVMVEINSIMGRVMVKVEMKIGNRQPPKTDYPDLSRKIYCPTKL